MFCNKCGKEIADGMQVCGYCGNPVGENQAAGGQMSGSQVYGEPAPSYSGYSQNFSSQNNQYQNNSYQNNQYQGNSYQNSQYQYQNGQYGYGTPQNMDGGATGLAVASMVLGIVALLIGCCASTWWFTVIVAVISIVLGILALQKKSSGRGMAIAGIVCSAIALVFMIIVICAGVALATWIYSLF